MVMLSNLVTSTPGFLFMVLEFLLVLSVVVFVHEFGHFIVARWCGVSVKTFSIGFGREIFGRTDRKGTRWRIAWVPLGGYVKFVDDENAASQPSPEALARMTPAERSGAFQN
jgi:regulator of sigma E protease